MIIRIHVGARAVEDARCLILTGGSLRRLALDVTRARRGEALCVKDTVDAGKSDGLRFLREQAQLNCGDSAPLIDRTASNATNLASESHSSAKSSFGACLNCSDGDRSSSFGGESEDDSCSDGPASSDSGGESDTGLNAGARNIEGIPSAIRGNHGTGLGKVATPHSRRVLGNSLQGVRLGDSLEWWRNESVILRSIPFFSHLSVKEEGLLYLALAVSASFDLSHQRGWPNFRATTIA
jgi:hypothetical protein